MAFPITIDTGVADNQPTIFTGRPWVVGTDIYVICGIGTSFGVYKAAITSSDSL